MGRATLLDPRTGRPEGEDYRRLWTEALGRPSRKLRRGRVVRQLDREHGRECPRNFHFPGSILSAPVPPLEQFSTLAETTTTADPGTAGTSLAVTTRSPFPQAPASGTGQFYILVQNSETDKTNREIMKVTAGAGAGAGSWTVARGQEGTTGVAHPIGSYVAQVLTAEAQRRWMPEYLEQPRHHNYVLWAYPHHMAQNSTSPQTLTPRLVKVYVPETVTITNVAFMIGSTAQVTPTAGSNRVGVYSSAGTLLSQSADITTVMAASAVVTAALGAAQTITGGPGVFVWLAFLVTATTMPTVMRTTAQSASQTNLGLAAADNFRWGSLATVTSGQGLPASFTPSTGLTSSSLAFWVGAS